jgi:hypothetical protein
VGSLSGDLLRGQQYELPSIYIIDMEWKVLQFLGMSFSGESCYYYSGYGRRGFMGIACLVGML